jgi:hypothetical protein
MISPRLVRATLLLLGAFITPAPAADPPLASPTPQELSSAVNVCADTGFFLLFLAENLTLSGNCDDADGKAQLRLTPRGLQLVGFGMNRPINLRLRSDVEARGGNITQFGVAGHTGIFKVTNGGTLTGDLSSTQGSCTVIAAGGARCNYKVVTADAFCTNARPADIVCGPCTGACPKYTDTGSHDFYVSGTPTQKCSLSLQDLSATCAGCSGHPAITAVE